jgi:hypothetical protein
MLRREALVRTDVWAERSASIIRVTRIVKLGITLAVTSNRCKLLRNDATIISSQPSSVVEEWCLLGCYAVWLL